MWVCVCGFWGVLYLCDHPLLWRSHDCALTVQLAHLYLQRLWMWHGVEAELLPNVVAQLQMGSVLKVLREKEGGKTDWHCSLLNEHTFS